MSKSIVIVEDDQPIREMYMLKLHKEGFEVHEAIDGVNGLEVIEKVKPDLVLLDILMPNMNGDDMLEKLRSTDWGSKIRVVVLTNVSKDEASHKLRLLNVNRYIVKAHYTPAQVAEVVRNLLK